MILPSRVNVQPARWAQPAAAVRAQRRHGSASGHGDAVDDLGDHPLGLGARATERVVRRGEHEAVREARRPRGP